MMTDGTEYKTRSTYGEPGDTLRLDIDPKTHPAYTGQHRLIDYGRPGCKVQQALRGHGHQIALFTAEDFNGRRICGARFLLGIAKRKPLKPRRAFLPLIHREECQSRVPDREITRQTPASMAGNADVTVAHKENK